MAESKSYQVCRSGSRLLFVAIKAEKKIIIIKKRNGADVDIDCKFVTEKKLKNEKNLKLYRKFP